jgi:hypothetical protein
MRPVRTPAGLRGHGRHQVLFGTDYPMITAAKALEHLAALELDDDASDLFLRGNAVRVCGLTAPVSGDVRSDERRRRGAECN